MASTRPRPHLNIKSDYLILLSNIRQNNWIQLRRTTRNKQVIGLKFVEDFSAWVGRNSNHAILEFVDFGSLEKFAANPYDVVDKTVAGFVIEPENRQEFFDMILKRTGVDLLECNGIPRIFWEKFENKPDPPQPQQDVAGECSQTSRTNDHNLPSNRDNKPKSYDNSPTQTPSQLNAESEYSETLRSNEVNVPANGKSDLKSYETNSAQSRPRLNVESDYLVLVSNFPRGSWKAFKDDVKRKYGIAVKFVETFSAWRVPQSSQVVLELDNYQSVETFTEKFMDIVGGKAEYEVLDVKHRDAFFKRIFQLTGVDMYTPQAASAENGLDEGNAQPVSSHSQSNGSQVSQRESNRGQVDWSEPDWSEPESQSVSKQVWVQTPSTSRVTDFQTEHAPSPPMTYSHLNVKSDFLMCLWNVSDQNWKKFSSELCETLDLRFIDAFDRWASKQVVLEFGSLESLTEFVDCLPSIFGKSMDYDILDVDNRDAFFNKAHYKTGVDLLDIQEPVTEESYGDPNELLREDYVTGPDTRRQATYIFDDTTSNDGGGFYVMFRNIPNDWIAKQVRNLAQIAGKIGSVTQILSFVVRYENPEEATDAVKLLDKHILQQTNILRVKIFHEKPVDETASEVIDLFSEVSIANGVNECDSDKESSIFARSSASDSTLIDQGKYCKENGASCSIIVENVPFTWNCDYMTELAGKAGTVTSCRQISNAIVEYRSAEIQSRAVSLFQGLLLPGSIVKTEKCDANGGYPCLEFDWDDGRFSSK
ncbi:hypothetical protein Ddc_13229 [Ditylenchus destructor]|nr:hypothetical protein Ddc_13229 [Ditylenchus destructor]